MNGAISNLFSDSFSGIILVVMAVFVVRLSLRKSFTGYLNAFVWLFSLSIMGFALVNLGILPPFTSVLLLLKTQNALLGLFEFSYLAVAIFAILNFPDGKKKRTLARLPLIGGLLGWYLTTEQMAAAFALVEIAVMFMLAKHRHSHNYLWRAQLKAFLPAPLLAMYSLPADMWFSGYLLWSLIFKLVIVNAAVVKETMLVYDKGSSEKDTDEK